MRDDRWLAGKVSVPKRHAVEDRIICCSTVAASRAGCAYRWLSTPEFLNWVRERITILIRICPTITISHAFGKARILYPNLADGNPKTVEADMMAKRYLLSLLQISAVWLDLLRRIKEQLSVQRKSRTLAVSVIRRRLPRTFQLRLGSARPGPAGAWDVLLMVLIPASPSSPS
jgi:hypothetical protein